ncbi:collagen alpha-1(I) chain-like [Aquila chrysaetos chrysaetos]|uniref:collagen alpha-1(I) chain-like n=1 Tax=Aquila chrysaetos chrysaetos TaxID=223781 RepID=UPI0011769881|nr:collagen alpha-1(I) chain-like [Aquila chrysaetos chrysaetos]
METRVPGGGGGPPEPQQLDRFSAPSAAADEDREDRDPFLPAGCGGSGGYRRNPRPGRALAKHPRGCGSRRGPPGERSPPPPPPQAAQLLRPALRRLRKDAARPRREVCSGTPGRCRASPEPSRLPPPPRGARFVVPHSCRGRSPAPLGARSAPPRVCAHPPRSAGHREPTRAPRCAPPPRPAPSRPRVPRCFPPGVPLPPPRPVPHAWEGSAGLRGSAPPAPLGAAGHPAGSLGREEGERPAPLRPPGERRGTEGGGWDGTERPPEREPAAGRAGSRGAAGGCGQGRPAGPRPPFRQAGASSFACPGTTPPRGGGWSGQGVRGQTQTTGSGRGQHRGPAGSPCRS